MHIAKAHFIIFLVLTGALCAPTEAGPADLKIEVFTDSRQQVVSSVVDTTVYVMDSIDNLQQALAKDLPADSKKSRQLVLARFQSMDVQLSRQLENAARGLAQAMQYGIDRYPAIVFDGSAVVYGVTDVNVAIQHYQQWRTGHARP